MLYVIAKGVKVGTVLFVKCNDEKIANHLVDYNAETDSRVLLSDSQVAAIDTSNCIYIKE